MSAIPHAKVNFVWQMGHWFFYFCFLFLLLKKIYFTLSNFVSYQSWGKRKKNEKQEKKRKEKPKHFVELLLTNWSRSCFQLYLKTQFIFIRFQGKVVYSFSALSSYKLSTSAPIPVFILTMWPILLIWSPYNDCY